jgi:hypothetical protein
VVSSFSLFDKSTFTKPINNKKKHQNSLITTNSLVPGCYYWFGVYSNKNEENEEQQAETQ